MNDLNANWQHLRTLARRARLAGSRRQDLELRLPPDESKMLADILDSALQMASAVAGGESPVLGEPGADEPNYLTAEASGSGSPTEEPEPYSDSDRQERFQWEQK